MEALAQKVERRTVLGKKVSTLRRAGVTPANVYGHGVDSIALQVDTAELEKLLSIAGGTRMITLKNPSFRRERRVLVKSVQRDAITRKLLHVDFYQVSMTDKIKVKLPLIFEGEAPALKRRELVVLETLSSIEVECLPGDIPENIIIDMTNLAEAGDHVLVSQLALSEKVTLLSSADDVVARVDHAKTAELEEAEEAKAGEEAAEEAEGAEEAASEE